jgi:hypothetical protein
MVAIGKPISFHFFKMSENVLYFLYMHSKFAKNANVTQTNFNEICMWYQKQQKFMLIPNLLQ